MALPDDFRERQRHQWAASAEGWEARRDAWRADTMPVSAWLVDAVDPQPGQQILELAAGMGDTGLLAAELVAPNGEVQISDFSPEMLSGAQRRAEELGVTNVRFRQVDAETSIDQPAGTLDGIICRWGFMLLADPEIALRECRRVLRPGGRVALAAWTKAAENPWSALVHREVVERGLAERPDPALPGQFAWAPEGVIADQLEGAGFAEQHVEPLAFTMRYADAEAWWVAVQQTSRMLQDALTRASGEQRAALRAAVDEHAARFESADGSLVIPACTWVAWASA
jgi:ubiquinone/menaquinone biosynthesis C-methylase UbiE